SNEDIPADLKADADKYRAEMLDQLSLFDDALAEAMLEENVTSAHVRAAIRKGTIGLKIAPVMMGSAYKNKGVQLLLDAVTAYLPDPSEVENKAVNLDKAEEPVVLSSDATAPLISLAFKLEDGRFGQLSYVRVY